MLRIVHNNMKVKKKIIYPVEDVISALGEAIADVLKASFDEKVDAAKDKLDDIQTKLVKKSAGGVTPEALRSALKKEYADIEDKVGLLVGRCQKGVSKKAQQFAQMFKKGN